MITTLNQKLMLRFPDRVGIVADSDIRIAKLGMNIASIEVQRSDDEAQIFLEVENAAHPDGHGRLAASLERVADLRRFATLKPSRWRSVKTGYGGKKFYRLCAWTGQSMAADRLWRTFWHPSGNWFEAGVFN